MRKALFLDRDGVINVEKGYVYRIRDFEFNNGIIDLCRKYQDQDYLIIVITNQAGIARKIFTEYDFHVLTDWMVEQFSEKGIHITKVYHCPHHPDFTGTCSCRKPEPGLLLRAAGELNLDLSECILVGDKETDIKAGYNAGLHNCFYFKDLLKVT